MMVPKFRAWYMPFKRKEKTPKMLYGKSSNILAFAEMLPDEYIVEQFTGLKDESDVDIYEGDIVRVSDVYGDLSYIDVIWGGSDRYPAFDIKNNSKCYDSNALLSIVNGGFEIIEVIGNIHDNPELLEAQHDTRTD